MDFNVDKSCLSSCRVLREAKAEQSVDCDITLPDYCCDIKSVLCCSVEPGISGVDITGNRITAMGNAVVRLLYVGDDDKITCFEQNYPVSKYVEMSALPQDAAMLVNAKTSYVNCRAVSPRRVDVHGCIAIIFSAVCCENSEVVSAATGEGLQLKQEPMQTCCAVGCVSKLFDMSEVIALSTESGKVKSVIHVNAMPAINETKTVNNKILIKGDLLLTVSLCCEDGGIVKQEHSMPINRIVELEGLNENSICDVKTDVSSLDVKLQADESGEMNRLDAAAVLSVSVYGYKEVVCAFVMDAYSLAGKVNLETNGVCCENLAAVLNETFVLSSPLDFSSNPASKVLDYWCNDLTCVNTYDGEKLELSGAVTVCVLYADKDNKPCFSKHRLDYRHTKDISAECNELRYEPHITVSGVAVSGSGNELNARVQFTADGCAFTQNRLVAVTDIALTDDVQEKTDYPAITVYFGDKGETLWDIAKKYNTTVDAVRRRNNVNTEQLNDSTMLIIPKV